MKSLKTTLLLGAALMVPAFPTLAQDAQPTPPARTAPDAQDPEAEEPAEDAPTQLGDVVVQARATDVRTSIDSISYSLADDLQAQTGTLADALRNVPSVEVDPDGNVSLRGDANVTILVDGRPSTQFNGPSRGQMVLQIPADQYARIEVMTNPSAAYSPEGSGGVINLISKPNRVRPGNTTTGSIRANVGDNGRWNIGANVAHVNGKLTLSADVGIRHDAFLQEITRIRERFDIGSGQWLEARQTMDVDGASDSAFLRLAAEYNLDDKTQLVGELRHTDVDSNADSTDLYEADNASGGVASAYRRLSNGGFEGQFSGATARVLRRFDSAGHEWSNEIRYDRARMGFGFDAEADQLIPVATPFAESIDNRTRQNQFGITSAYTRPFENGGKLRLGYELDAIGLELDNGVLRGPIGGPLVADPLVSNEFHVDQTVHAAYVTYERPFGEKLSAQFGLRLEQAELELNQITSGITAERDYFRAYPTLHVSYQLDDTQSVRGSYSRRIQRPGPADLNPFLTYQDSLSYRAGNPNLLPQETDAFELMWQKRAGQTFYQATLYYRDTTDAFTPVTSDLGGGVFLTRPENLGARTATGLELVASGSLHSTLRYNASVNLSRQEIDASNIPGGVNSEADVASGRLTLNWQPTADDFIQVTSLWTGDQPTAQGVRESSTMVNLGYRRKLNASWSLQATVRDVFDNFGAVVITDTPAFREYIDQSFGGRAMFIGLTWNFGQGQRRPEQFDFSGAQTGG